VPSCECGRIRLVKVDGFVGKCRVGVRGECVSWQEGAFAGNLWAKCEAVRCSMERTFRHIGRAQRGPIVSDRGLRNGQISPTTCPPLCTQSFSVPENPQCVTPGTSMQSATRVQPK
jgi:hypothetical protein